MNKYDCARNDIFILHRRTEIERETNFFNLILKIHAREHICILYIVYISYVITVSIGGKESYLKEEVTLI